MAEYRVTGPDGTKYKVTGPDGATDQQVLSQVQAYKPIAQPNYSVADPQIPGGGTMKRSSTSVPLPDAPETSSTLGEKIVGAGETAAAIGSGMVAGPVGSEAGLVRGLTGGKLGTQAGVREGEETAEKVTRGMTYQPRTPSGQRQTEAVGEAFRWSGLAGLNPSEGIALGSIAKPSAGALKQAAAQSPEAFALKQGVSKVGQAMRPNLDPQVVQLAQKAEQMGIKIPPDMLSDNKFLRIIGQASREVPLSGAVTAENRAAWNRAINRSFGGDPHASKISVPVHEEAMNRYGAMIGDISEKYPINAAKLKGKLDSFLYNVRNETPDVRGVLSGYLNDMQEATKSGKIDGTAFRKIRSELGQQMRRVSKDKGDLKHAMSELDDVMLDAIQENLSPEEMVDFTQARHFYSNGKVLEPLIAQAARKGRGDMSPAALASKIKAKKGDLVDISAVGNRFLTEPPSSLTAERGLTYGILGGLGGAGFANPLIPATIYGGANLYNRLGPRLTRGMIPRPPQE